MSEAAFSMGENLVHGADAEIAIENQEADLESLMPETTDDSFLDSNMLSGGNSDQEHEDSNHDDSNHDREDGKDQESESAVHA